MFLRDIDRLKVGGPKKHNLLKKSLCIFVYLCTHTLSIILVSLISLVLTLANMVLKVSIFAKEFKAFENFSKDCHNKVRFQVCCG